MALSERVPLGQLGRLLADPMPGWERVGPAWLRRAGFQDQAGAGATLLFLLEWGWGQEQGVCSLARVRANPEGQAARTPISLLPLQPLPPGPSPHRAS